MHRTLCAALLALTAALAPACGDPADETPKNDQSTELTRCTLVGCSDVVVVDAEDLLARYGAGVPLTVEVTMDGETVTATIDLGAAPQKGCWQNDSGIACCSLDPPGDDFDCIPQAKEGLQMMLHVKTNVFDKAEHTVSIVVRASDGGVLFMDQQTTTLHMYQPNGPKCEPTCYEGGVHFLVF